MSGRYLIAAFIVAAVSGPLSAQSVEEGVEAWQQGNYAEAVGLWQPLGEAGDADAQYNLGQAYRIGRGVPANAAEARKWFELAAKQGQVDAQAALGLMLMQSADTTEALRWLKLAAEQSEPRAMLVYGAALYKGEGVARDAALGYDYVSKAAALGLKPAKDTLAQIDALNAAAEPQEAATAEASVVPVAEPPETEPVQLAAVAPAEPEPAMPVKAPEPAAAAVIETPPEAPAKPVEVASLDVPKAAPRSDRHAGSSAAGAWRVQLGAFSQKGNAEGLYRKLAGSGALAGRKPFYVPAGAVTKLQVGPFESKSAAAAACKALTGPCIPVTGK